MKTRVWGIAALIVFLCNVAATPTRINYKVKDSYHSDFRSTPKILFDVNYKRKEDGGSADVRKSKLAKQYLLEESHLFGVGYDDLVFVREQKSLLGQHYRYKQMVSGYEVMGAEIIVSVDKSEEAIARVFNSTYPVSPRERQMVSKKTISESQAYDIVWQDLHVRGKLLERPSIRKVFFPTKDGLVLSYLVKVAVEKPFGYWKYILNAVDGKVLERSDRRLTRRPVDMALTLQNKRGELWPRLQEFNRFNLLNRSTKEVSGVRADGQALVFDPDPRTTLKSSALQDDSPAGDFEAAYFTRTLRDLTQSGGRYTLKGPWITIADFESPATPPSTSADGSWMHRRGEKAFNDAMTYFHIDQNQRYMQSLGFKGDKGIQQLSIYVDADGVSGQDNSHFVPSTNRIAFGHGCVDDNEDADVILHEYGHAIHFSINSNWRGGDTGAMGEGFGDYWAGSYSLTTENGDSFNVNQVFNWDGHGDGSRCWSGRMMNKHDARYDHSKTYTAHTPIENGDSSDELWSTPLFQTLLELINKGYAREEVDRIILEAHFGLGSALKMRDMANAIVQTAKRLYPGQEHSEVFVKHFVHHGIIELPTAKFQLESLAFENVGANNQPDPGETIGVHIALKNTGTHAADSIRATLTSLSDLVTTPDSIVSFSNSGIGDVSSSETPFSVKFGDDFECGKNADFKLKVDYNGGALSSQDVPLSIPTGVARKAAREVNHSDGLPIPDHNPAGIKSELHINSSETVQSLKVKLKIEHTFIGDLVVTLTAPDGKSVDLHRRRGAGRDSIIGVYPDTLDSSEPLKKLMGSPVGGKWTLKVADEVQRDTGALMEWGIEAIGGYDCE